MILALTLGWGKRRRKIKMTKKINHITTSSEKFLAHYLNTASPTGFESTGQKVWLDYIKPYIDKHIVYQYMA